MRVAGGPKLEEWRRERGWSQDELATALTCSQQMVSALCGQSTTPGTDLATRIQVVTRGRVKVQDWLPPEELEQTRAAARRARSAGLGG